MSFPKLTKRFVVAGVASATVFSALLLTQVAPQLPATGTWARVGAMGSARTGASSVLLPTGRVMVMGGAGDSTPELSAETFGLGGSFSAAPPMLVAARNRLTVALPDGRVLTAGGVTSGNAVTNAAELYDPKTNLWTPVAGGLLEGRSGATAVALADGSVLVSGGRTASGAVSATLESFDPSANAFRFIGVMNTPRVDHAAALLPDGSVLLVGGSNGSDVLSSTDIFNPANGSISAGPVLTTPRTRLSATVLLDGSVLLAGGNSGSQDLNTAELYTPETRLISPMGSSLSSARSGHTATLLPNNGGVLIAGGTSSGVPLATAELFRRTYGKSAVSGGTFIPTGSMLAPRAEATATPLAEEGFLLIAGGKNASGILDTSEVYGFATIRTGQPSYHAGEHAIFSGRGWAPGESVTLTLTGLPGESTDKVLAVTADEAGRIAWPDFVAPSSADSATIYLNAIGATSWATTRFRTESDPSASVKPAPEKPTTALLLPTVTTSAASTAGRQVLQAHASQSFFAGSLIIPMDTNTTTTTGASHTAYNQNLGMWKAYGLVNKLLSNGIPVYWAINQSKTFSGTDFTATVQDLRTTTNLGTWDYSGGPFIISSANVAAASPLITAWWAANSNYPNVHKSTVDFSATIDIVLRSAPRIANETTNSGISIAYYNAAGIPDGNGNAWSSTSPGILTEAQIAAGGLFQTGACLTRKYDIFVTPHNSGYTYSLTNPADLGTQTYAQLDTFVHEGGGWTALCHSILSNENNIRDLTVNGSSAVKSIFKTSLAGGQPGGFLTTGGFSTIDNTAGTWTVDLPTLPAMQAVTTTGATQALPGGSVQTWPSPGNTGAPTYYTATERVAHFQGAIGHDNIIAGPYHNGTGLGKLTYIGGHSFATSLPYSSNYEAPFLRAFYNSLFFNGSAVAKMDMTVSPTTYPQGSAGQPVIVSLTNTGASIATNVNTVSVTLNTGFTYVGMVSGNAPSSISGQVLSWTNIGDVAGGATPLVFQLSVNSSLTGSAGVQQFGTFQANYGDIFGEGFTANVCRAITVAAVPGPTLTKTPATRGPVGVGAPVTWTLNYSNTGSAALSNTVLQDTLPAGFTYQSSSSSPSITPTVIVGPPGIIKWNIGTLAANATGSVTITALAGPVTSGTGNPLTQTFTNNATLTGDSSGTNYSQSASAQVSVQKGELSIGKTVDKSQLTSFPGSLTYTINPAYTGTDLLNAARVIDPLPTGVTFTSAGQGGTGGAYVPVAKVDGIDNNGTAPNTQVSLSTSANTAATGGSVTVTMTLTALDSSSGVSAVTPDSTLVSSDGSATCAAPSPSSGTLVFGTPLVFTYTCTMVSPGEVTFNGGAGGTFASNPYNFNDATSSSIMVSVNGATNAVIWNLGTNTAAVGGTHYGSGVSPALFAFQGNVGTAYWRYDIVANTWSTKTSYNAGNVGPGGSLAYDGAGYTNGYVYGMEGNSAQGFSRYDISADSWTARANTPAKAGDGGAVTYLNGFVYAMQGAAGPGTGTAFWKYDPSANSWSTLANTPASVAKGGSLTNDGALIYALLGNNTKNFYVYNPGTNTWTVKAQIPTAAQAGAALTRIGNLIYATVGNASKNFYVYSISADTWTAKASLSAGIKVGGAIANDGTDVYAMIGNNTTTFYKYTVSTNTWATKAVTPAVVGASKGGGALVWVDGSTVLDRQTTLAANPMLVSGATFTTTMTVQATSTLTTVAPGTLTVTGANGASANCGSPSPASIASLAANTNGVFTWTCTATAGSNAGGTVTISGAATASGGNTFPTATANSVLVEPSLTFVGGVAAGGPTQIVNEAFLTGSTSASAMSSPVTTNTGNAVLTITKANSPTSSTVLKPGDPITYTFVVQNTGSIDATTVTVTDVVPTNTVYTSCTGGTSCSQSAGTVTWNLGTLSSGATSTLTMVVNTSTTLGVSSTNYTITNSASATSAQNGTPVVSNSVTNTLQVKPTISKAVSATQAQNGDTLTYTLVVANPGASFTGTVSDVVPTGASYNAGSCSPSCTFASNTVTWSGATLAAGNTTFTFTANITGSGGATVSNIANLTPTSPSLSAIPSNQVDTAIGPNLALVKLQNVTGTVTTGNTIIYTLSLSNESNVAATGTVVSDVVPTGTTYSSCTTPAGTCANSSGTVSWNLGTIAAGATASMTLTVTVGTPATGQLQINNIAQVTATNSTTPVFSNTVSAPLASAATLNLLLVKTASPTTYNALNDTITYSYALTNLGTGTLSGTFAVTDSAATVTCPQPGSLAPNATLTCSATYHITSGDMTAHSKTNTATATVGATTSNVATATVTQNQADLAVTKSDGTGSYTPGNDVTYTIGVTNNGPQDSTGFTVTDTLPSNTTFASASSGCVFSTPTITCTSSGLALNASTSWSVTLHTSAARTGSRENTAQIATSVQVDPTSGNNTATDTDYQASLALTKVATPTTYSAVGAQITYNYTVTTTGNVALGPAQFTVSDDHIGSPLGTAFNCGAAATTLAPNATVTCSATYTITQADLNAGSVTNHATASGGGVTSPQVSATATAVGADLAVAKSDSLATYTPGQNVIYTIGVTNNGPSANTGFTVTDVIPSGMTFVGASSGCVESSGTVTCTSSGLALHASTSWTVTLHADSARTGNLVNTASIGSNNTLDPTPGNNTATDTDTPAPVVDLAVTNTDGTLTYTPGGTRTYTVVVTNSGPSSALGASVSYPLPSGLTGASWTATTSGGAMASPSGSGSISDTVNVPPGGSITYTVVAQISAGATAPITTTATVSPASGTTDSNLTNNAASDTDTSTVVDMAVSITDGVGSYVSGGSTTYTVVVANNGPGNAAGASFTLPLATGITGTTWTATSSTGASGFPTSGSGAISNGGLYIPAGGSIVYTVTEQILSTRTGSLTSTATVAAPVGFTDPTPANNTASDVDLQWGAGLGLLPGYPLITGNNTSPAATSYNAATQMLTISSVPSTIKFTGADITRLINSGTLTVGVQVNNGGFLVGGVAGDDIVVTGTTANAQGVPYTGTLLTGEVTAFGFKEGGSVDRFDFRFHVTGGALAALFTGQDIGLVMTAENSTFNNSFQSNFTSTAKFNLGPVK